MKSLTYIALVMIAALLFCSQPQASQKPEYNAQLAKAVGADERGMKLFIMGTLKTGPNDDKITDKAQRGEIFKGHFANMERLSNEKKLVLAGPYVEARPMRGLLLFNVTTLEEAEALIKTDPAVEAGIFIYELHKFYGSAALMQIADIHKTISKQ